MPLTYPFALTFPSVSLVTGFDFPFAAMGAIHRTTSQYRPIAVTGGGRAGARGESARTPQGLPVDLVTNVSASATIAWHPGDDVPLHQQRTSLSGEPKPPPQKKPKLPRPAAVCGSPEDHRYAAVGGDLLFTTRSRPKLFGFYRHRARDVRYRGVLAISKPVFGRGAYSVPFAKPVLLPATAELYVAEGDGGWGSHALRNMARIPHLTTTVRVYSRAADRPAWSAVDVIGPTRVAESR